MIKKVMDNHYIVKRDVFGKAYYVGKSIIDDKWHVNETVTIDGRLIIRTLDTYHSKQAALDNAASRLCA